MSWVDHLPENLELLSLLSVSTVGVSNVAVAPPTVYDPVVLPANLPRGEAAKLRREYIQGRRARSAGMSGMSGSSSKGARKQSLCREDVLSALSGLSGLGDFFVLGFTGMLTVPAIQEFARMVYAKGIADNNSFTVVTMDDYSPVFSVAFRDLINPCSSAGKSRNNIGTRNGLARSLDCSTAKAGRLLEPYNDTAHILMQSAQEVSQKLHVGLRRVAA